MAQSRNSSSAHRRRRLNLTIHSLALDALLHPFSFRDNENYYSDLKNSQRRFLNADLFDTEGHPVTFDSLARHTPRDPHLALSISCPTGHREIENYRLSEEGLPGVHRASSTAQLLRNPERSSNSNTCILDSFFVPQCLGSSPRKSQPTASLPELQPTLDESLPRAKDSEDLPHPSDILNPVLKTSSDPHFCNDNFKIDQSETAGWGAFATRDLLRGDVILRERPLFIANSISLYKEFNALDQQAQGVALSLYANERVKQGTPILQAIWDTNRFATGNRQAGLFPIAARFNHACHPAHTVDFHFDHEHGHLVLRVRVDKIAAGDELRITYGRDRTAAELYMTYGFRCQCGACPGLNDEESVRLTSLW
ncbi:hypothetical protein HIM_03288 [Hirsutella minnesotensis 3608]|nr:hypothetical protein HIM_03288 [Hirsutella minnesotensis 3608]